MIIEQLIFVKVTSNTKKHYEQLGYNCKKGDTIMVLPSHLMENSMALETRKCDYCRNDYQRPHQSLRWSFERFGMDICPDCYKNNPEIKQIIQSKREKTNLEKYKAKTPVQNQDVLEKIFKTNIEKYGVRSSLSNEEVKSKISQSILNNWGVTNPMKNNEIKEKAQLTCQEKYGVKNPMKNPEILKKAEDTNIKKYGYKSSAQNPEVREKMRQSLIKNQSVPTSRPQIALFEKIKELYPNYVCELNYPVSKLFLDTALFLEDIKIDIEYDGIYWHKDKKGFDFRRDTIVKKMGYKVLRVKSNNKLPSDEELLKAISELEKTEKTFVEIFV